MGCNCGSSKNNYRRNHAARSQPTQNVPVSIPAPRPVQRSANGAFPVGDSKSFCQICGWLLKKSRYIEVRSNTVVERIQCTNPRCSTRR